MVQKKVYVQKLGRELEVGNLFCHWAILDDDTQYPEPSRIKEIGEGLFGVRITLANHRRLDLRPEGLVVVQEVA